ncbi:MAG: hypothetical protein KDD82_25545 [Planctomycetes bacterium]|nr:hypothetical protein [Planctomycetota bacterium]
MKPWRWVAVCAAVCVSASAQERATRGDLALAYMAVERALASEPQRAESLRVKTNRDFDQATLAFFSGATGKALRGLRALTVELLGQLPGDGEGIPLGVTLEPAVWVRGSAAPRVVLAEPFAGEAGLELRLVSLREPQVVGRCRLEPGESAVSFSAAELPAGVYTLEARARRAYLPLARFTVCDTDPEALRGQLSARLDRLPKSPEAEVLRARLGLLTKTPDPQDTTQVLSELPALGPSLRAELASLERGDDPYRARLGSTWRPYRVGGSAVGLRVYAPEAARRAEPLPLVVAFHGAGGDENMFAWGYGGGVLEELAEEHGFLLASPRTEAFVRGPGRAFEALLATLADDYRIDRRRIYCLGHSLGVMALDGVLRGAGDRLAGALCFSGMPRARSALPTHALLGANDPLVPARSAKSPRPSLELEVLEGYGHTLGVGPSLPAEVEWLLGRPGWL